MKMKEIEPHDISYVKLLVSGCNMIIFQASRLKLCSSFLMAQLNEVGNIGILVLWQVCEKLDCGNWSCNTVYEENVYEKIV